MNHCWLTSVPIPFVLPTLALWTHLILKRFGGPKVFSSQRWAAVTASSCSHHARPCPAADFISSVSHHGPCVPLFIPRIIHSTHVGDWWEFPGGPVVRTSCFHCLWDPGWSLVRELRFHKPPAVAKRKTRQWNTCWLRCCCVPGADLGWRLPLRWPRGLEPMGWDSDHSPTRPCLRFPLDSLYTGVCIWMDTLLGTTLNIFAIKSHFWRRKRHPTPVLLPGESQGRRSLAGHGPWGHRVGHAERLHSLLTFSLEEDMATHSSVLAWRIPWMEEPGGPWSMGSQGRTRLKWLSSSSKGHF